MSKRNWIKRIVSNKYFWISVIMVIIIVVTGHFQDKRPATEQIQDGIQKMDERWNEFTNNRYNTHGEVRK